MLSKNYYSKKSHIAGPRVADLTVYGTTALNHRTTNFYLLAWFDLDLKSAVLTRDIERQPNRVSKECQKLTVKCIMERPEIVQLLYSTFISPDDVEQLFQFLSPSVEWILSAADPQTLGEELPSNVIQFSGTEGFRKLALYFRDRLHVISCDLTGCIPHYHLVFSFGRVRLRTREAGRLAETNIAAKLTFQGSKIIKCQIRISWPLAFDS